MTSAWFELYLIAVIMGTCGANDLLADRHDMSELVDSTSGVTYGDILGALHAKGLSTQAGGRLSRANMEKELRDRLGALLVWQNGGNPPVEAENEAKQFSKRLFCNGFRGCTGKRTLNSLNGRLMPRVESDSNSGIPENKLPSQQKRLFCNGYRGCVGKRFLEALATRDVNSGTDDVMPSMSDNDQLLTSQQIVEPKAKRLFCNGYRGCVGKRFIEALSGNANVPYDVLQSNQASGRSRPKRLFCNGNGCFNHGKRSPGVMNPLMGRLESAQSDEINM